MAEQDEPRRDLSEVLLAMDVVDTLRHQQAMVERELRSTQSEAELVEQLRRLYAGQGIAVSDEVLRQGVRALQEERFAYRPPPPGFKTRLARLYVHRGRWARRVAIPLVVLVALWAGYRFLYAGPAARARVQLAQEVNLLGFDVVKMALEPEARQRAETLQAQALSAVQAGNLKEARAARSALQHLQDLLAQEYTLQVVSRPGTPSGVWRQPADHPERRNYYLIVEAVAPDGRRLQVPVTSEEDGRQRSVTEWGIRVPPEVYEGVSRDKAADGIVDQRTVGVKPRGSLTPRYQMKISGGAITEW